MKRIASLACLVAMGALLSVLAIAAGEPAKAPDVLIIHAAGTPTKDYADLTAANIDAVTCPTPVALNCKVLADQVAEALRAKGLEVRVVEAGDIKNRDDLLRSRLVVLASPTYFGTCSWRMHRLFHEQLWPIFHLGGKRLDGRLFAEIAIARGEGNFKTAIEAMQGAVKSANGTAGPTMGVTITTSPEQVKERAAKFADEAVAAMKGPSK